jgi:hypothetical protein
LNDNDAHFEKGAVYTPSEANRLFDLDVESKGKVHLIKTLFYAVEVDDLLPKFKIDELNETDEVVYYTKNGQMLKYHKQDGRIEIGLTLIKG